MAKGTISASILTDIANAIRKQAGVGTTYKPSEMADAVAALDGTDAGSYVERAAEDTGRGLLTPSILTAIADAIRGQNGESTKYKPSEMAPAILALEWDAGFKVRALLLEDGTLEFSYREGGRSPLGTVVRRFEVDPAGYASAGARPWDEVKLQVRRAVFDPTFASAGTANMAYWFLGFANMTEVTGFENIAGATDVKQLFTSCSSLETVWCAGGFDSSAITSSTSCLYGCSRLVGGTDGYVPSATDSKASLKVGAHGVLTDPTKDARAWLWAFLYADGEAVVQTSNSPEAGRDLLASGRVCANARYAGMGFTPWDDTNRQLMTKVTLDQSLGGLAKLNMDYWFYACKALETVEGMGNLKTCSRMHFAFVSCTGLTTLDLRGFDPSRLTDLVYTFSGCTALTTIWADEDFSLPSGVSGAGCFYGCSKLVGGAGTAYSSSRTTATYLRIDGGTSSPGYLST